MAGSRPETFLSAAQAWSGNGSACSGGFSPSTLIFGFLATQGMVDRARRHAQPQPRLEALRARLGRLGRNRTDGAPEQFPVEFQGPAVIHFSVVFMIFMLFFTGGILATYVHDEKPAATNFFEACGYYFWRFFRLLLYLLIVFLPIGAICMGSGAMYTASTTDSISPFPAVISSWPPPS